MPKVILIGSPQTQWNIGDRFVSGNTPVELTDAEIKKHKDIVREIVGIIPSVKQKPAEKKLTEEYFYGWNKVRQVKELEKLGIKPARREEGRVKQLMEAQK